MHGAARRGERVRGAGQSQRGHQRQSSAQHTHSAQKSGGGGDHRAGFELGHHALPADGVGDNPEQHDAG